MTDKGERMPAADAALEGDAGIMGRTIKRGWFQNSFTISVKASRQTIGDGVEMRGVGFKHGAFT